MSKETLNKANLEKPGALVKHGLISDAKIASTISLMLNKVLAQLKADRLSALP